MSTLIYTCTGCQGLVFVEESNADRLSASFWEFRIVMSMRHAGIAMDYSDPAHGFPIVACEEFMARLRDQLQAVLEMHVRMLSTTFRDHLNSGPGNQMVMELPPDGSWLRQAKIGASVDPASI